jgi:hypothetical protein
MAARRDDYMSTQMAKKVMANRIIASPYHRGRI